MVSRLLKRFPVLMASFQTGSLMCVGDIISQTFVEKKAVKDLDWKRTARFGAVGLIVVGPVLRTWYGVMERKIVLKTPAATAMAKVATDQLLFAPFFLCQFLGLWGFLNGHSWEEVKADIKRTYGAILIRNYQLWPAAQMINFWLVPLQHRVLFVQSLAVIWNTYLSYMTNAPAGEEPVKPSVPNRQASYE